jgi:hypothetical protein
MSKIAKITGKLPFAGRSVVENSALSAICERDNPSQKTVKSLRAAGFLAVFAGLHGLQAKLGFGDFMHDTHEVSEQGLSVQNVVESTVSGLYTLANTMVTYTQLEISGRVMQNYLRFRSSLKEGDYRPMPDRQFEPHNAVTEELVLTSIGQVVFMSMFDRGN